MNIPPQLNPRPWWWRPTLSAMTGIAVIATVFALELFPTDKGEPTVIPVAAAEVAARSGPRDLPYARQEAGSPAARSAVIRLLILERAGMRPFGSFR
jgi:hypothetical protein